jgi:multiple sugar transport system permease protein
MTSSLQGGIAVRTVSRAGDDLASRIRWENTRTAYLFLLPTLAVLALVILYPFLTAIWISLTNKTLGGKGSFIGLGNYRELLVNEQFRLAFWNSFYYSIASVLIKFGIGLVTALILNVKFPLRGLVRVLIIIPWAISPYVAAMTWRWIFHDPNGFLNIVLMSMHVIRQPISWLSDQTYAMLCIIAASVWQGYPFYTMMLLAGLVTIPKELYEAAEIDGGNKLHSFTYITVPSLTNVILTTILLSFIWTFNQFQFVFTMTRGGPAGLTHILSTLSFLYGIEMRNIALASAVSVTALPVFVVLTVYLTRIMLKHD